MTPGPRDQVLTRVKRALEGRTRLEHPGALAAPGPPALFGTFRDRFTQNGGEVVGPMSHPMKWLTELLNTLSPPATIAAGNAVPADWVRGLPVADPQSAHVAISIAWGAAADSGSVLLESTGGRRVQLLSPVHAVCVPERAIHPTLTEALQAAHTALPATLGVHSGPSKSADIGSTLVRGVHGPGRIIAVVISDRA